MRFLSIYYPDPQRASTPPTQEHMESMGKLIEESKKSGSLIDTGGLMPITKGGAIVRSVGGTITVTDGPFTESKEMVAGFAILQASSTAEAVEAVKHFLGVAGDGVTELRVMLEPGDMRHIE